MAKKQSRNKPHHKYYDKHANVPKLSWLDLLGTTAASSDDQNIGKVEAVNSDFVVIKKGTAKVSRFYVPTKELKNMKIDGNKLNLGISKDELSTFREDKVPNPSNFATLGSSTSHMAYPPIPYLPNRMLKEKYKDESIIDEK